MGGAGAFGSLDTALNIAFPDLVADFDLSVGQLQWVVICFVAVSGGLLVPAGALGDRVGHTEMVFVGAVTSAVAMALNALAPSFGWLLAGRAVQGLGTAAVMASAPALATLGALPARRHRAIAVFQSASAIGLASGPIIGGVLVALIGWRGVFWFRVPLAAALAVLALLAGAGVRSIGKRQLAGASGAGDSGTNGSAADVSARSARLGPLVRADVIVANLLTFGANGAMFATWLLVPALLVDEMGVGLFASGVVLALSPAFTAVAAARAPSLAARVGARAAIATGLAVMAAGMALTAGADRSWPVAPVVLGLALVGAGLGLFSVPNMAGVMAALPPEDQGVAGSLNLMMRTLGIVSGAAWHGALFDRLEPARGFGTAFGWVFAVAACVLVAGAVTAWLSPVRPSSA